MSDHFSTRSPKGVCLLYSQTSDKINILLRSGVDGGKLDCGKILKDALLIINGRGGGRADLAQGSGTQIEKINNLLKSVKSKISEVL